jgi:hypothetical protein
VIDTKVVNIDDVRCPAAMEPLTFVLELGPDGLQAAAATFDRARDGTMLAALLPAVRAADAGNTWAWLRANPWH